MMSRKPQPHRLFITCDNLVEVAFEEVAHAVLGEGGGELGAKVAFAVDVEQGADVGDFVGEEGEGVLLLAVNFGVGGALHALAVGSVVDAQRQLPSAVDYAPCDGELACVGEHRRHSV